MTHIEQLHLEAIQKDKTVRKQLCVNDWGTSDLEITVSKKSAEITEQIACEFAECLIFHITSGFNNKSTKELFHRNKETSNVNGIAIAV